MSVVVGTRDLGNPLAVAAALKDIAQQDGDYPALFGLLEADGELVSREYELEVRQQARRALADRGHKLQQPTRRFLSRVSSQT